MLASPREGLEPAVTSVMKTKNQTIKPIRVCVVAASRDWLGGQSIQAARLLEGLKFEPDIEAELLPINPRLPGALQRLRQIKYVRTVIYSIVYCALLFLRLPRFDVVHVFAAAYVSFVIAAAPAVLIAKLYGKKVILHYHSGEAEDHLRHWRWTTRPIMWLADTMITPSGFLVDVFAQFGLRARAIFNVIDLNQFHFRERRPFRPVFLTSRLLEPLYNVGCVLRAFSLIQQQYPEARLTVAGDGWMRPQLEELARDLDLRNTKFTGRIPFDDMAAVYDAADIYLTATDIDNMPSSITECFTCGLPVVTTDAGGLSYILTTEETGLMVPCGDHEALAASAIRLLVDQELATRIARQAREAALRFTWDAVRGDWVQLYREVASSGGRKAARGGVPAEEN